MITKKSRELFAPIWKKNQSAVDGKPFVQKYLYQYNTESDKKFNRRKELSAYNNLPDTILQRWLQIFNKGKKTIETEGKDIELISEDIDRKGNDTSAYANILFKDNAIFGSSWNLIDLPEWDSEGKSEQERLDNNIYPYVSNYTQDNVIDWDYDDFGNIIKIVVDTGKTITIDTEEKKLFDFYVKGYKERFYYGEKNVRIMLMSNEIIWNGQPVMPWVVDGVYSYSNMPDYYKSPMNAINDASVELYNRGSASGNAYDQTDFQFLAVEDGTIIDQLGNDTLVTYLPGASQPLWVAPNSGNFEQTRKELSRMSKSIFELAGMKSRAVSGDVAKSGEAMRMEDAVSENKVELIGGTVERTLNKIWDMLILANGNDKAGIKLTFPDSYAVDALSDELDNLSKIFELKNNAYYLIKLNEFVRRTVSDTDDQQRCIEEAERNTGLRLSSLQQNDVLITCINNGTLKLANLAKEIEPTLKDKTDEEINAWIMENGKFLQELNDKFGLTNGAE